MKRSELDAARNLAKSVKLPENVRQGVLASARWEMQGSEEQATPQTNPRMGKAAVVSGGHAGGPCVSRRFAIAAALASAAALGTAAYAAIETNFFTVGFGSKGHEDVEAHEETFYSKDGSDSFTAPQAGRTWYETDSAVVENLLGDCVQQVNESVTVGDYTMTLESFAMDENDLGIAWFVVTCPKGFKYTTDTGADEYGAPALSEDSEFRGIGLDWEEGRFTNYRPEVNEEFTTPTELHLLLHFDANPDGKDLTRLTWSMNVMGYGDDEDVIVVGPPEKRVEAIQCTSDESKFVVSVSPFGYVVDKHAVLQEYSSAEQDRAVFMMDDGTELVALEELEELDGYSLVTYNLYFSTASGDRCSTRSVTTFFIDTDALESVALQHALYNSDAEQVGTDDAVFYPER